MKDVWDTIAYLFLEFIKLPIVFIQHVIEEDKRTRKEYEEFIKNKETKK